ncbi:translocation/assembly module TamB [Flavobacterium sp.]|uniref:translocation/assembly module TamB domain-containing protein n=1 Tax=Flavobacterium sp. TaxID=239 RepID=UPI0025FAA4C3|nr:translocation/assembly module TamB [Flavobacterium sp.]
MKKYFTKGLRIILWVMLSVIGLVLVLFIAVQIPAVQQYSKDKAVTYLEEKLKTKVVVDKIQIGFPNDVILEGVYFQDQEKDTLLAGKKISANLNMYGLFNNKIEITSIELEDIVANINRNKENKFSFDYIAEAFKSPEKQNDNSPPMAFSLDKIELKNIRIRFNDVYNNNDFQLRVNYLKTRITTFDLIKMNFEIPQFTMDGLLFSYKQGVVEVSKNSKSQKTKSPDLKLKLGILDLTKIKGTYEDENSKVAMAMDFDKLLAKVKLFDFKHTTIDLNRIELSNATLALNLGKKADDKSSSSESNDWKVKSNEVAFKRVNFIYNNNNSDPVRRGMDYQHLDLTNLSVDANNFAYNSEEITGKINAMKGEERKGLKVEALKTNFYYGPKSAYFKDLYLKTSQTTLRNEISIGYPSIESLADHPEALIINAHFNQSTIAFKDLLLVAPQLYETDLFNSNQNAVIHVNSTISGKVSNLYIPNLQLTGFRNTTVNASGRIIGLPDSEKAYYDLNIKNFKSNAKDFYSFIPKNSIPNNIQLPEQLAARGTFKGTIKNFATNMLFATSAGNAKIKGTLDRRVKDRETYNLDATLDNFDLGRFLKNDSIGRMTLRTAIKGSGFNPKTATAVASAAIVKATYNHYTYQNVVADGKINHSLFDVKAFTKDPNLQFDLVSSGSFKDKYPKGTLHLNVDIADLDKLNLHAGPLKLKGVLDADIQSANLDYLNGNASVHHLIIANEKEQYPIDSINLVAVSTPEKNSIVLNSQFLDAEAIGKYRLTTLANSVKNSISNYYNLKSTSKNVPYSNQQLAFKVNVKPSRVLLNMLPTLKNIEPILITGRYNSVNDTIIVNGSIPKIVYGTNVITNAKLKVDTKDKALLYSFSVDEIRDTEFQLHHTSIVGQAANDIVDYTLLVKDFKNKDRYLIAGKLKSKNGGDEISFDLAKLMLNYDPWNISEDNKIRFGNKALYFENFVLSNDKSSISLQSLSQGSNPPLAVEFKDFKIETLTNIVQMKNIDMEGNINGKAVFKDLMSKVLFTADATIDNFTFKKEAVGIININVDNYTANTYTARIELTGLDNQLNLNGTYRASDSALDMDLDIPKLNLKSVQGFSMENITDGTGYFTGRFKVSGNTNNPKLIGNLSFHDIGFKAIKLNAKFKSINDKIAFTDNAILLDNFTIYDEKNNDLTINGKINNQNYANLGFDLTVDADNFKAVNSSAKDNDTFYGQLYLDNHLLVRGTMESPYVEGNMKINEDTKFTIVLPQDDPSLADREGIVEFIDQDQPRLFTLKLAEPTADTEIRGLNASVNIEIDKDAEMSLIIDKGNGDFLRLKGEAQLTGGIDPSGKTTLIGRYELVEGSYEMSFNLVKRKFDIKKGSYILWTGEPTTADINITAVYRIETAPIDLLNNQLSTLTPEERNTYKQRIPFETELKMRGDLLKPSITFDIILPEGNNSVSSEIITKTQAKLAQLRQEPDDLNKQVFALLLLNRFIGEDPFSSESGGTTASILARESVSKILSQQLNNFAGDLIKGFEVDFDLDASEDYTTGQKANKTDLNVGLSKKLLNDRLKVTVGSSFGIEGPEQKNKEANTIAGDLAAEYQISKDGRYKVRAYRKNLYQVALQGQVIETGVGFIITLDYNKFSELFHLKKDTKPKKAKKTRGEAERSKTKSND